MKFMTAAMLAVLTSCGGGDATPEPEPAPEPSVLSLTCVLKNASPFKNTWGQSDGLLVSATIDGKKYSEKMTPSSISADGATATITSKGAMPAGADKYYAYLGESGITGTKDGEGWVTADMKSMTPYPISVLAATSNAGTLSFRNVYAAVKVTVTSDKVKSLVFEGRQSETVNRENIISFADLSISPGASPGFQPTASISGTVTGAGDYYVNLYPGLVLSSGYKVSGYDARGVLVALSESTDRLETASGTLYQAPAFQEFDTRTRVFDPENIALSFGVISDVHLTGDVTTESGSKFKSALTMLQTQARKDDAGGIDAVLVVGDLLDSPYTNPSYYSQADLFKSIYESVFNPVNIPMIYTIGNHDVYGSWCSDTYSEALKISSRLGENYFLTDKDKSMLEKYQCRHCQVGDCHVLCITPYSTSPVTYPSEAVNWLDEQLEEITLADPEKYVLVLTHPMIYNTVYGSTLGQYWYTTDLTRVLSKYPQVIVFGGHLHFPINDPRSIWQDGFTSVGCGSVRYMAIENGKYEYMSSGTVMNDSYDISSGHLLQIDGSGNIRITRMFFTEADPFTGCWTLLYPTSDKSHLAPYRFDTRKSADTAPQISSLDAVFYGTSAPLTVTASFAAGTDDEFVHHYVLTLSRDGSVVSTKNILSDFYHHRDFSQMKGSWDVNMGPFGSGTYELSLTAYDSWDERSSTVTKTFTIE